MGIYGLGNIVNRAINLLLLPFFTAYLTPVDYGIQSMFSFMLLFLGPLTSLGIGTSFGICYTDKEIPNAKSATVWSSFAVLFVLSACVGLLCLLNADRMSAFMFSDPTYAFLIQLTALTFLFNTSMFSFNAYLQFERKALTFVTISLASALFNIGINCYLVMGLHWGIYGLVWGALLANLFQFLLAGLATIKDLPVTFSKKVTAELVRLGVPMISGFFFLFLLQNTWRFVLERMQSMGELGIFSVGYNIGCVSLLFLGSLTSAWAPYFLRYEEQKGEMRGHFSKIYTAYYLVAGLLTVCFFAYSKFVITVFTAPPFHECWKVVGWIAMGYLASGGYYLCLPGMYFAKRVYLTNISYLISSIVTVVGTIVGVWMFGMLGAAVAFFIGQLTLCICQQAMNYAFKLYVVPHEFAKLLKLSAAISVLLLLSYAPRELSIFLELLYGTVIVSGYVLTGWVLLEADQRKQVLHFVSPS